MKCVLIIAIICIYHLRLTVAQFDKTSKQILNISFAASTDELASEKLPNVPNNYDKPIYLTDLFESLNRSSIYILELQHIRNVNVFKNATFEDFSTLTQLSIRKGKIKSFPETLFRGLNHLTRLIISQNELKSLTIDIFADLPELQYLDLSNNQLTHLPDEIFENLFELRFLILTCNKLSSLSRDTFIGLNGLEGLYLDQNNITSLSEGVFPSVAPGMILDLSFNNISSLHERTFSDMDNMAILRLSKTFSSTITNLPHNLFLNLTSLETIEMNDNYFKYLPDDIFHSVLELKRLNLAYNKLTLLNDAIFKKNIKLEELNLEGNQLQHLSKNVFSSLTSLTKLNLASNHLSALDPQIFSQLNALEEISTANNRVNMSGPREENSNLYNCPHVKSIYASNNTIPKIYQDWYVQNEVLIQLDLRYNPIPQTQFNINLKSEKGSILLTSNDLLLFNITHSQPTEVNGQTDFIYILDKNAACDADCACVVYPKYDENKMEIRCQRFDESELEEKLPDHLVKYFSSRYIELILTNCNLTTIHPLQRIFNQINVTKLSLSSNKLTSLDGLPELSKLEILEVHDNQLTNLDAKVLEVLKRSVNLTNITLHNNPWNCDCSLMNFKEFVTSHQNQIWNPNSISCHNQNDIPLLKLPDHKICHLFPLRFVIICTIVAIFGVVAAMTVYLYHEYKNEIKVWMFSHKFSKWLVTEKEIDRDKKYDAFISYSHQDEWFVFTQLIPNLENDDENQYKLCVHYRDWLVGVHIPTQIYRSVAESRRTIIILSPNFLTSYWARKEFQEAYVRAMADRCPRVIIIMLEDIGDRDKLDDELKAYISTNTYLAWGDPLFWKRLRFVLPHKHGASKPSNTDTLLP